MTVTLFQTPPEIAIIRDARYAETLKRDTRRQRMRRWMHRLQSEAEKRLKHRVWREETAQMLQGKRLQQVAPQASGLPRVSICLLTMNSAERILPLLAYIRPHCHELVVAVDSKTTDQTFEVCEDSGMVDELYRYENPSLTCNAGLEEMVRHCHGEWVLRLDDDEFPEPELWECLAGILQDAQNSGVTHFKMPRLHLAEVNAEAQTLDWIDDGYLYPDYQMRLFQNKPELLSYPGAVGHGTIDCQGKRGKLHGFNLVHLNMAINPRFKREEKLANYVRRLKGDWVHPVNEYALMFENFGYKLRPYGHADEAFTQRLIQTTVHQRQCYLEARHQQRSHAAVMPVCTEG